MNISDPHQSLRSLLLSKETTWATAESSHVIVNTEEKAIAHWLPKKIG